MYQPDSMYKTYWTYISCLFQAFLRVTSMNNNLCAWKGAQQMKKAQTTTSNILITTFLPCVYILEREIFIVVHFTDFLTCGTSQYLQIRL